MGSTVPAKSEGAADIRVTLSVLRWRDWPLADRLAWSWIVPLAIVLVGAGVGYVSGEVWLGVAAAAALALSLWKFLLPIDYELNSVGFSRELFGWRRVVPWQAVGAYQARTTGVVLFQRDDPSPIDALWSEFLPYSADEDETLCTVRHFLPHAVELPA